jgi:hypothetical protein
MLNIFAFSIVYVKDGGDKLGVFTKPLKDFSEFPRVVKNVIQEFRSSSKLLTVDPDFHALNHLRKDVFAMNSEYEDSEWIISLTNLKNDAIIHRWYLKEKEYLSTNGGTFSHAQPNGSILLEDRSIIMLNHRSFNLFRLDRQSNIIWHNTDHLFHHSINPDKDGNVWVCTRKIVAFSKYADSEFFDEYITKIDGENGTTLFNKSIREILIDNDLTYLVYGFENQEFVADEVLDPFHLNEIEPVLENGPYWKAGDLFLSLRHRSTILLYRPSTNRVLRVISGPFLSQHDIDIKTDSTIVMFNNNISASLPSKIIENNLITELSPIPNPLFNKISSVLQYNFSDSTFSPIYQGQFIENKIKTRTQGVQHILSNGDMFVESTDEGIVYIFNENEVLLKKYLGDVIDSRVKRPHWTRIYENINF